MADLSQQSRGDFSRLRLIPPGPLPSSEVFKPEDRSRTFVMAGDVEGYAAVLVVMPGLKDSPSRFRHSASKNITSSSIDHTVIRDASFHRSRHAERSDSPF